MTFPDNHPDLTDIRSLTPGHLSVIETIDFVSQETPLCRDDLAALMNTEGVFGILATRNYRQVGFSMFNIQDDGSLVFINRFSVTHRCLDLGVCERMVAALRDTQPNGPLATLRTVVSEYDIGSPMFDKLLSLGFRSTGVSPRHFFEYSRVFGTDVYCDGIKLELS